MWILIKIVDSSPCHVNVPKSWLKFFIIKTQIDRLSSPVYPMHMTLVISSNEELETLIRKKFTMKQNYLIICQANHSSYTCLGTTFLTMQLELAWIIINSLICI